MAAILETFGLTKHYRHNWTMHSMCVLDSLTLSVAEGEVFGLIGPNGAGKTTTFKLVLGLLRPTAGSVVFRGSPLVPAARAEIGFLPEQAYFYDYLTVEEALALYAALYGMSRHERRQRVDQVIEQLQLGDKRRASLRTLSKGTLQRVGVAQAVLNRPRLAILDEPMSGLDPAARHHMRELIGTLREGGTTVIFSSHILPDAEALCDRVGILVRGRLREVVSLRPDRGTDAYELTVGGVGHEVLEGLERLAGSPPVASAGAWRVRLRSRDAANAALDLVRDGAGSVESLAPVRASLEERFLKYVGNAPTLD